MDESAPGSRRDRWYAEAGGPVSGLFRTPEGRAPEWVDSVSLFRQDRDDSPSRRIFARIAINRHRIVAQLSI
jgi:hypothetical protein